MNWTPPPETHRVDAITGSSGRIQDEPATVQPQDSYFQMQFPETPRPFTEAELDEFREDRSRRLQPPVVPETHRVGAITDSSGRIQDEPATVQPQDSYFQMQFPETPRPFTEAELDEFREDRSRRLHINDIFLSQGLEPPILFQPPVVPETHRVGAITDSWGRTQEEPATVQPQDSIFQMPSPQHPVTPQQEPIFLQPQDVPPPEEPERRPRPLTEAELEGMLDNNAIFLSQGLEPIDFQPQEEVPSPEEPERLPRPLTEAELDEFRDSSGILDMNAILMSQGFEPIDFQPQEEVPPPEEPERLPRPLTEAELDEFRDSSGMLVMNAIFMSQGLEPIDFPPQEVHPPEEHERLPRPLTEAELEEFTTPEEPQPKGLSDETISKYLKTMNADEIRAHDKDGDQRICAVCLDDVCRQKDIVAILDDCGHEFHYCCLKKWLRRKNICPLCRRTAIFLLGDDW